MCPFLEFCASHSSLLFTVCLISMMPLLSWGLVSFKSISVSTVMGGIGKSLIKVAEPVSKTDGNIINTLSREKLPWSDSIVQKKKLSYMPMFEAQLQKMREMGMEEVEMDERFICRTSDAKPARIGSMCFKNEKFRKVRMTYFDAGDAVQVFNTLWYPAYEYDMPLLGVDLISLGKNRVLSVIDMQPVHPTEEYSDKYISQLSGIRDKYKDLHGTLSGKIYNDTSFFSKNMLFGRFTDESKLMNVVNPAFNDYLNKYLEMMDAAVPDTRQASQDIVMERQKAYDIYSALKDPAIGLFDAYFGKEWSNAYVHEFLFEHCKDNHS